MIFSLTSSIRRRFVLNCFSFSSLHRVWRTTKNTRWRTKECSWRRNVLFCCYYSILEFFESGRRFGVWKMERNGLMEWSEVVIFLFALFEWAWNRHERIDSTLPHKELGLWFVGFYKIHTRASQWIVRLKYIPGTVLLKLEPRAATTPDLVYHATGEHCTKLDLTSTSPVCTADIFVCHPQDSTQRKKMLVFKPRTLWFITCLVFNCISIINIRYFHSIILFTYCTTHLSFKVYKFSLWVQIN